MELLPLGVEIAWASGQVEAGRHAAHRALPVVRFRTVVRCRTAEVSTAAGRFRRVTVGDFAVDFPAAGGFATVGARGDFAADFSTTGGLAASFSTTGIRGDSVGVSGRGPIS
jgi:hypothetical protein